MRYVRFRASALMWLLAASLALSGCGTPGSGTGTPAPSPSAPKAASPVAATATQPKPAEAAPAKPLKIRYGVPTFKSDAGFNLLADSHWRELGVEVELVQVDSNVTLTKALVAGELDVIEAGPNPILSSIEQGAKVKIIGASIAGIPHVLYAKSNIRTLRDLDGKAVGVSAPGSFPDILVSMAMQKEGLDPKTYQRVNAGGSAGRVQSLLAGKIDATASSNEWVATVQKRSDFHVMLKFGEVLPNMLRGALVASDKAIAEKPEALRRFMQGLAKGIRDSIENRNRYLEVTGKALGKPVTDEELQLAYDTQINDRLVRPDVDVTADAINYMQDVGIRFEQQKARLPESQVLDMQFMQHVVKSLGAYKWK